MSDYDDDSSGPSKLTPSWLNVSSAKVLLDRTTKFVLNAAHGKSRSLIPTTDNSLRTNRFDETGVVDWDEHELYEDEEDEDSDVENGDIRRGHETIVVPEVDVLRGYWNSSQIISRLENHFVEEDEDEEDEDDAERGSARSLTPPGMIRIRVDRRAMSKSQLPPRIRTKPKQLVDSNQGLDDVIDGNESTIEQASAMSLDTVPQPRKRRSSRVRRKNRPRKVSFITLPSRVISRVFEYLPVPEMLSLLNTCRVLRRVMHRHGPSGHASDNVGVDAYTVAGIRVWNTMIKRMGWRIWYERIRGKEKRQRVSIPRSHGQLLKNICGVDDEEELLAILHSEPDLLFKAIFDNLYSDYIAFRSLENNIPKLFWRDPNEALTYDDGADEAKSSHNVQKPHGLRTPAEVAERLDQLLWFGRGQFTHDADLINHRVVVVADRFESAYREQFKSAFIQGDCARMNEHAQVLENIREGRGCIRILVDAHPLFNCYGSLDSQYAGILTMSDKVIDSHTFHAFLGDLQLMIEEHSRVVSLVLPPPTLPVSALYCFIKALFETSGVALSTLRKLYAHLRSIPVASAPNSPQTDHYHHHQQHQHQQYIDGLFGRNSVVVPDEATKDILYLTTVADAVSQLLTAADNWSTMAPVAIPVELGKRCVFSAFDDVIDDYVQLERRIIERAYDAELDQWFAKVRLDPMHASAASAVGGSHGGDASLADRQRRDSVASARGPGFGVLESIRLVNFRQRVRQMDEYKLRVLRILEEKLNINLPPEALGIETKQDGDMDVSNAGELEQPAEIQKDEDGRNNKDLVATKDEEEKQPGEDLGSTESLQLNKALPATPEQQQRQVAENRLAAKDSSSNKPQREALKRTIVGDMMWSSPISIDMCLNMVVTNRDAVDRLSVFAEAPPDMRIQRLAQEAIETMFCILLQSVGNHVRPAFTKTIAELRQLEHSAMVVMVPNEQRAQKRSTASGGANDAAHSAGGPAKQAAGTGSAGSNASAAYTAQRLLAEKELRERFTSVELRFFELIHLCDLAVQMLEIYYKKDMCMFIVETDFLNICNQEKKALERAIDDNVAVGMDCVIEIILRQTQHILDTEQTFGDYHPDSNTSLTLTPTLACTRAVQFLSESTEVISAMTTQKQMREVFLGEIGVRLFHVLLDHIKQFQITEPGGFQLIADLNLYYDWAETNVDPETLRFFTALKDLANCFILAPRDLRGFLRDQYSRHTFDGVMRSEEVYDVVACRADYRQIRSQVEGHCDFM